MVHEENGILVATRGDIAQLLGLTEDRIAQLHTLGVLHRVKKGVYDFTTCIKDYIAYIKKGAPDNGDMDEEKLRKLTAEANLKELELKEKIDEIVRIEDVERQWGQIVQIIRQALLSIPTKLAPEVTLITDLNEAKALLERAVREILLELSESKHSKAIN